MLILICVGHANYGGGVISSADGTRYGGVNEYLYNKELAPHVVDWLRKAGHEVDLCIAPEGQLHNLNEEINYFMEVEHAKDYDIAVQLHLNAFNSQAYGCEAYAYNDKGLEVANAICAKLGTVWHNRGGQIKTELYWTRKTKAMSVLVESFFCDNAADYEKARRIGMSAHAKLIAEGIQRADIVGNVETPEVPQENTGGSAGYATGLYRVNVGELNIRKGPGTNYGTNGSITDNGTYTIVEIQNGSWGRLKSGAGWINVSTSYCSYIGNAAGNGAPNTFQVKVEISDLYIRKGPSTGSGNNGFCPQGVYTIVETQEAEGYTWGRLKSGAGWIALEYTTKL